MSFEISVISLQLISRFSRLTKLNISFGISFKPSHSFILRVLRLFNFPISLGIPLKSSNSQSISKCSRLIKFPISFGRHFNRRTLTVSFFRLIKFPISAGNSFISPVSLYISRVFNFDNSNISFGNSKPSKSNISNSIFFIFSKSFIFLYAPLR